MKRMLLLAAVIALGSTAGALAQTPPAGKTAPAKAAPAKAAPAAKAEPAPPPAAPTAAPEAAKEPAPGPFKPDLVKAQTIVSQVCVACHGADGNSPIPINPNLAAQPAEYISQQLAHFKAGVRANPIMLGMATMLSPDDMKSIGVYFSQQKPKVLAARDPALVAIGQKLYRAGDVAAGIPACAGCHAPNGAGVPSHFPRLAGQNADYALAQLKAFKAGERGADKGGKDINGRIMTTIAGRLSEDQMKAVAEYTQGLH
jgi:cytochrome c553